MLKPWIIEETGLETIGHVQYIVHADWLRAFFNMVEPTELKNDCACVTGDPVGQSRSRLPSRRDIWRENIDLNNTFRMKEPRVS